MKKLNLFFYFFVCFLAFAVLVFGKLHFLGRYFLQSNSGSGFTNGDMYDMAEIDSLKGYIPVKNSIEDTKIEEAKIFTLGDSFFQSTLASENFANLLEEKIKTPVYNIVQQSDDYINVANPLIFLQKEKIQTGKSKVLILESVDWRSQKRARNYLNSIFREPKLIDKVNKLLYENGDVEYFVRRNKLANSLRQKSKNWEYDFLNEIDARVGALDEKSGMAFYFEEVNFHKNNKTDNEIEEMAKQILALSEWLEKNYNIKLLYINMPSKFAVYGSVADKNFVYDGFSTNLHSSLESKGVNSVDVYNLFLEYKNQHPQELLYYPSDSHFTPVGKGILLKATALKIQDM
ncbi:MAG: hypothetical protein JNN11_04335 [Candidatus Doudnabacteria bacterium]|nr:hypothetical protein [Candidatus Doudnabacteria bacterium]